MVMVTTEAVDSNITKAVPCSIAKETHFISPSLSLFFFCFGFNKKKQKVPKILALFGPFLFLLGVSGTRLPCTYRIYKASDAPVILFSFALIDNTSTPLVFSTVLVSFIYDFVVSFTDLVFVFFKIVLASSPCCFHSTTYRATIPRFPWRTRVSLLRVMLANGTRRGWWMHPKSSSTLSMEQRCWQRGRCPMGCG